MPFGAFAEIMPNVDGLIHISQIADRRIGKPEDVLTIGEEVEAKVTDLNWDEKKISLSIRALIPTPEKEEEVKEEEAPVEDHNAETLVYSTDPEVEVEEAIEVEADDACNNSKVIQKRVIAIHSFFYAWVYFNIPFP